MRILFLHGWHSIPGGVKPTFLASHDHEVVNPALPDEDFSKAIRVTQAEFDSHKPDFVVGSSRGGAVAMNINSGDTPLVLLCPACKKHGTARTVKPDTVILHSRADEVVPFADSEELVKNSGLPPYTLIEVGNDHRLADPESLEIMLEACSDGEPGESDDEEDILERDWTGLCYTAARPLIWRQTGNAEMHRKASPTGYAEIFSALPRIARNDVFIGPSWQRKLSEGKLSNSRSGTR